MKKVFQFLMLTVMLKVWWHDHGLWGDMHNHESIYMNCASLGDRVIFVRDMNGSFNWVYISDITTQKWVDVKADK